MTVANQSDKHSSQVAVNPSENAVQIDHLVQGATETNALTGNQRQENTTGNQTTKENTTGNQTTKENTTGNNPDIISANCRVLLTMPSENAKIITVKPGSTIDLGKFGQFKVDDLIGKYFGFHYEIQKQGLVAIKNRNVLDGFDEQLLTSEDNSNQLIDDDRTKQKLSYTDIETLKQASLQGDVDHNVNCLT